MSQIESRTNPLQTIWGEIKKIDLAKTIDDIFDELSAEGRYKGFVKEQRKKGLKPIGDAGVYKEPSLGQVLGPQILKDAAMGILGDAGKPIDILFFASDWVPLSLALPVIRAIPFLNDHIGKPADQFESEMGKVKQQSSTPIDESFVFEKRSLGDLIGAAVVVNNIREGYYKEALIKALTLIKTDKKTAIWFAAIAGAFSCERERNEKDNFERDTITIGTQGTQGTEDLASLADQLGLRTSGGTTPGTIAGSPSKSGSIKTTPGSLSNSKKS